MGLVGLMSPGTRTRACLSAELIGVGRSALPHDAASLAAAGGQNACPLAQGARAILVACLLLPGFAPLTLAQPAAGNIYAKVADDAGAAIPGATARLKGPNIGGLSTTSNARGEFHFLLLDPETYAISVSQKGFATVTRNVIVTTGVSVELAFKLRVAVTEQDVTVDAETPVVDTKKIGTSATLTQDTLARTPNARDPWALLRTVPGVLVDAVNVAGNRNDQQAGFVGKGADFADSSFVLDGTSITDDGGSSAAYFDFDAFQEISVSTGGSDLRAQTGGINITFTTKRGTNKVHGSARGFFTHDDLQWSNLPAVLAGDPRLRLPDGTFSDKADHIRQLADYGAEVGGPIVKDKLWAWAAFGRQDIRVVRLARGNQDPVDTYITAFNAKLNWQAGAKDMLSFFYFLNQKEQFARAALPFAGQEADSYRGNQGVAYPAGAPHGLYKLEESHVFAASLFLNATYTFWGDGSGVTPRGGTGHDGAIDRRLDLAIGSSLSLRSTRAWQMADLDLHHFRSGLGGSHELRFGFGYRHTPISSISAYSGSKVFAYKDTPEGGIAQVHRDGVFHYTADFWDTYLGDTYTRGRLTLNAGLRFDHQTARNLPSFAAANPVFPDLLPALDFQGGGQGIEWNDVSPRAGVTWALDGQRKTVARVSYARYAGRLAASDATNDSPIGNYGSFLAYKWVDKNHDGFAQKDEILVNEGVLYARGIDLAKPTSPTSPNRIDPNYTARHDQEIIVGIDRELLPSFALSVAYTWRRNTDRAWTPRIGLTVDDYTPNPPETANGFTTQTYSPDPSKVLATGNGTILMNRPDYRQTYSGFELSLAKRLSHRWMARAGFAYMDWHENFLSSRAFQNPTRRGSAPLIDGGQVAGLSFAPNLSARWQVTAEALYELPRRFEVAASCWARQGFLNPYILNLPAGFDGTLDALASRSVEDHRLPDLFNLDLRVAKTVKLHGDAALVLSADLFNAFNHGTVIDRNATANSDVLGRINGIMNPRIIRLGLRLTF
jgi:hypothetical protein